MTAIDAINLWGNWQQWRQWQKSILCQICQYGGSGGGSDAIWVVAAISPVGDVKVRRATKVFASGKSLQ